MLTDHIPGIAKNLLCSLLVACFTSVKAQVSAVETSGQPDCSGSSVVSVSAPGYSIRVPAEGNCWVMNAPQKNRRLFSDIAASDIAASVNAAPGDAAPGDAAPGDAAPGNGNPLSGSNSGGAPCSGNSRSGSAVSNFPGGVLTGWNPAEDTVHFYFHTDRTGLFDLGLVGRVPGGSSVLRFTHAQTSHKAVLEGAGIDTYHIGRFEVVTPGYQRVAVTGAGADGVDGAAGMEGADGMDGMDGADGVGGTDGMEFPQTEIFGFLLGGPATGGAVHYVRDDFYWGKRGPSVHLGYRVPAEAGDVTWFYNEITVPEGEDVLGSYFMANGFSQGYFGMQVNSPSERRILFSVWSPYHTDNPAEIPDDQKIVMLDKGPEVYTGEFGNEGSGGQSFLRYNWKAGNTYGFLLRGEPEADSSTVFTAWFFAPEEGSWRMIASFRRPHTFTHLSGLHSFLENFHTETGAISRKGLYTNQWVCNTSGEWFELTSARFTADATARKNARLDYAGGTDRNAFFMKNCGFTNDHTVIGTWFERPPTGNRPVIDVDSLPGALPVHLLNF
ncbi:MAG: DUF3472 domain-containing protein [Bacteroidales bacterium]|nr:DUF3472 domain-containing protein [Bacteroidales bacterium]